jgi:hypothetical protein
MNMKTNQSRRKFIATAVTGTVAAAVAPMALAGEEEVVKPTIIPKEVFGANDRIRVAVLGLHGRGGSLVETTMQLATSENVVLPPCATPI